jgi:AcrR family transcriptional regulator
MNCPRDKAVIPIDERAGRARRDRILDVISRVLTDQKPIAIEMRAVVEDSGLPLGEVIAEFPDLNDLVVAIASRQAARVTEPLRSAIQSDAFDDVRSKLIEFGTGVRAVYSSMLLGFLRLAMTDESGHKEIRRLVYEEGPAAITAALCNYLDAAARKGKLAFVNSVYATESLLGMLREPLYGELTLHPQEFALYEYAEEAVEQAVDIFLGGCNAQETAA